MEKILHRFKKKYGQNFLNDKSLIKKIVSAVPLNKDDLVIEIGPGAGIMTNELVQKCRVLAYEIDTDLKEILKNKVCNENLNIIWDDFLNRNLVDDLKDYHYNKLYVIANLPYYITTPIIMKLTQEGVDISNIVIMVQKEVADRFIATPGNKEYGSITVFLNFNYNVKKLFNVSRNAFYPKPNVDSAIISLSPNKKDSTIDSKMFFEFVRDCFSHKRKTLKNNLQKYDLDIINNVLITDGYDLSYRAEQIPLEVFIDVYKKLNE